MHTRRALLASLAAIGAIGRVGKAAAEGYPTHPITMDMPFAAGGPGDVLARMLAERMSASLGQNVIVDNITGAAGSIGRRRLCRGRRRSPRQRFPEPRTGKRSRRPRS